MFFFWILLFLSFFSCEKLITYKGFVLTQTPYTDNELRIDGYYHTTFRGYSNELNSYVDFISVCCFYRNGILLDMGGAALSLEEADEYIRKSYIEGSPNPKHDWFRWGLFVINNQTIKFERYYPSDDITRWTYIREGKILNDTTFHITVSYRSDGKERRNMDEIYHFRQFYPKPDSTNTFIK